VPIPDSILVDADLYAVVRDDLFGGVGGQDLVGLEQEMFLVERTAHGELRPVRLTPDPNEPGAALAPFLASLADREGWDFIDDPYGAVEAHLPGNGRATLEPAGQLEYSSPPLPSVAAALADVRSFFGIVEEEAARLGMMLVASGFNTLCRSDLIDLQVRKPRYLAMDRHFSSLGPFGRMMMRQTCALQINLDFGSPSVGAERWRLANMIAPSLNALFANSAHTYDGCRYRSFRGEIWRNADPTRTGRLFDRPDLDPIADYLRFALDATVMLVRDDDGGCSVPERPMTFRGWLRGSHRYGFPDRDDWNLHLSTLFPDVRARGYMEVRSIDSLPLDLAGVPVALVTTLMHDDHLRGEAIERLESRQRRRDPGEHEHGGYWTSDFLTGVEMLELALPAIGDAELQSRSEELLWSLAGADRG